MSSNEWTYFCDRSFASPAHLLSCSHPSIYSTYVLITNKQKVNIIIVGIKKRKLSCLKVSLYTYMYLQDVSTYNMYLMFLVVPLRNAEKSEHHSLVVTFLLCVCCWLLLLLSSSIPIYLSTRYRFNKTQLKLIKRFYIWNSTSSMRCI